jgi:hypothetical protein
MRRAGLKGVMGRRRRTWIERPEALAVDLVDRAFTRMQQDEFCDDNGVSNAVPGPS